MSQDWLLTGQAGERKAQEIKAQRDATFGPRRVYLKNSASANLVFLDNDGAFFWEHQLKIDGNWMNWFTCLRDFKNCEICSRTDSKRYYAAAYSVINLTGYTKKDGTHVPAQKELLIVKSGQFDKMALKRTSAGGDLTMGLFKFTKLGAPKEPSIGSEWEFLKKVSPSALEKYKPADISLEDWLKPFDYAKEFAPKSDEAICKIFGWSTTNNDPLTTKPMSQGNSLAQMDDLPGDIPPGVNSLDESSIDDLL